MAKKSNDIPEPGDVVSENPFDPKRLRLSQNFAELAGVKKILSTVPTNKPNRQEFIRTHPDPSYRLETAVLEMKEDRETYLVDPDLWSDLPGEVVPKILYTTINRQGTVRIWPIRLPGEDGRHDAWSRSALKAAEIARTRWVRVAADLAAGFYQVYSATGDIPEPEWPEIEFQELLQIAFRDKFITDVNHPVIKRLRGAS